MWHLQGRVHREGQADRPPQDPCRRPLHQGLGEEPKVPLLQQDVLHTQGCEETPSGATPRTGTSSVSTVRRGSVAATTWCAT